MPDFLSSLKHHILRQYQPRSKNLNFRSLADEYDIPGGESTIRKWYRKWDGTATSLDRKPGSGCPRLLNREQVKEFIQQPIKKKRRSHEAIHYTDLMPSIQENLEIPITLRTVRRYGRRDLGVRMKATTKRTAHESKYT